MRGWCDQRRGHYENTGSDDRYGFLSVSLIKVLLPLLLFLLRGFSDLNCVINR